MNILQICRNILAAQQVLSFYKSHNIKIQKQTKISIFILQSGFVFEVIEILCCMWDDFDVVKVNRRHGKLSLRKKSILPSVVTTVSNLLIK